MFHLGAADRELGHLFAESQSRGGRARPLDRCIEPRGQVLLELIHAITGEIAAGLIEIGGQAAKVIDVFALQGEASGISRASWVGSAVRELRSSRANWPSPAYKMARRIRMVQNPSAGIFLRAQRCARGTAARLHTAVDRDGVPNRSTRRGRGAPARRRASKRLRAPPHRPHGARRRRLGSHRGSS